MFTGVDVQYVKILLKVWKYSFNQFAFCSIAISNKYNMKLRYTLNNKKLQKKLNLQATITEKKFNSLKVATGRTNYKLRYNENKLYTI